MNRKPVILALAALLVLVVALPATPTAAAKPAGTVYLALGDSLAEGFGATDPAKTAYVPHLFNFFHGQSHLGVNTLVNLAIGGETSTSFITNGQLQAALTTIATKDVAVVTFDIGGNDLLGLMAGPCRNPNDPGCIPAAKAAMDMFGQNYAYSVGVLDSALAGEPNNPPLMVMTYYNPWSGTGSPYEAVVDMLLLGAESGTDCSAPLTWGMNDIIKCVGLQYGADVVADTYPPFVGKGLAFTHIGEGDIHPNNAGYAHIATAFREAYFGR